jgi:hypothetical protein
MIKADGAAGFDVIHPEPGSRFALFRGSERGEAQHVRGAVKKLSESAFEIIVGIGLFFSIVAAAGQQSDNLPFAGSDEKFHLDIIGQEHRNDHSSH